MGYNPFEQATNTNTITQNPLIFPEMYSNLLFLIIRNEHVEICGETERRPQTDNKQPSCTRSSECVGRRRGDFV